MPGSSHLVIFDPEELTLAQCDGDACVVCHKRWPRPRVRVGRLPDGRYVLTCEDCAELLSPLPPRAPDDHEACPPPVRVPVP